MANENEKKSVTGLDLAADRKEAEYDLVKSLLAAADYKEDEDAVTEVSIKRAGRFLFAVHIHPISDPDLRYARKKSTTYMPNPNGRKLPPIEKEFDNSKFSSWIIYLATTDEDREKIWGNPAIKQKFDLQQPVESIDILLTLGEKRSLSDEVLRISGLDEDVTSTDDEQEQGQMDEETFQ